MAGEGDHDATRTGTLSLKEETSLSGKIDLQPVDPYSEAWAKVLKPITITIFVLVAVVIVVPLFIPLVVADEATREATLDWAKTALTPVVGFASAAVAYYYGTRQGNSSGQASDDS